MTDLIYQYQLWRGMFEDVVVWAWVFYLMQIADGVTTYIALKLPGSREGNPAVRWVMDRIGILPSILIIKAAYIVLMYFGARQMGADAVMLWSIFYVGVVIWNIGKIHKFRKAQKQLQLLPEFRDN